MNDDRSTEVSHDQGQIVRRRKPKRIKAMQRRRAVATSVDAGGDSIWNSTHLVEKMPELLEYWRIMAKRKKEILALTLAIVALVAVIVFAMTPIYRATATVLIEQNRQKVVSVEEVYSGVGANKEHFQTQSEIIKSREVLQRVATKYKLWDHPEFDPRKEPGVVGKVVSGFRTVFLGIKKPSWDDEEQLTKYAVETLVTRVAVEPVRLSQLIKISFESANPQFAAQIANGIVDAYVENDFDARYQMSQKATDWLNERLGDLKGNLEKSEQALQAYREREGMVDSKGLALGGASRTLEEAAQKLVEAKRRRSEAEFSYNIIKKGPQFFEEVPDIARNAMVMRAKDTANEVERKLAELGERYGREHPRYIQAESDAKSARDNLKRVLENAAQQVMRDYEAARASEQALESAAAGARGQIKDFNRKEIELNSFEREVQSNRQIYQTFLSRFKETNATENVQSAIARSVEKAVPPRSAVKPKRLESILIAAILGLIFSIAIALMIERLDNTIKSTELVEQRLHLPMVTALPLVESSDGKPAARRILDEPRGIYAEAIRTARTAVLLSAVDVSHKILAVTSSVPEEGKSTFAMNLALAHSHTKRTLLIDADMRRPSVARSLGLPPTVPGLSELVAGTASVDDCIIPVSGSDLNVLSAGKIPPNPLELLLSSKFGEVLARLQRQYDFIVIDTPPVNLVSDSLVISQLVTGMLFVVRAESTPIPLARRAIKSLRGARAPMIGVIVNRLDMEKASRYYGDYGVYGYGAYGKKGYYGQDLATASVAQVDAKSGPKGLVSRAVESLKKTGT